jgi:uncharacterized protein Yka (UPF0111/DUF47 family)
MFSLQQLFSKADRFQSLLETSAADALESVRILMRILKSPVQPGDLEAVVLVRRRQKKTIEEIGQELINTFVTGLEREDIEAISHSLYKITKAVEKFAERYALAASTLGDVSFGKQAEMMERSMEVVVGMVAQLRNPHQLQEVKQQNDRLQYLEGEADKLMVTLLGDLYRGRFAPLQALIVKDLYELIEKVIDRCRDTGNAVVQVVLKNS